MKVEAEGTNRLLVVDDEKNIRRTLKMILQGDGIEVVECATAEEALALLGKEWFDLVLLDIRLPGMDGMKLLERVKSEYPAIEVIMISGHGSIQDAVGATRMGAFDFLEKPLDRDRVVLTVRNCLEKINLSRRLSEIQQLDEQQYQMVGESPVIQKLWEEIRKVAPTNGRVLITGESGTGKELVARAIHRRSEMPFVKVNCAAIPAELIESELFGYERGAFTGAVGRKKGQFELANGGTLFLDEVGDMSLAAQAKVLRALQTGEITHVGGERTIKVDVRVIAATNKDLRRAVEEGAFRDDLYYRLNVVPIRCAPLRERMEDIPLLASKFVSDFCRENNFKPKSIDEQVLEAFRNYHWPGNIRELRNVIEHMVIMSGQDSHVITTTHLPEWMQKPAGKVDIKRFGQMSLKDVREEVEREFILAKLHEHGWNISRTASALGVERTNLHKKMKQLGIRREGEQ